MFLDLFGQECKKISKNILYYALIIIMVLFYATQYATDSSEDISLMIREPRESDADYGYRYAEIPEQVMSELAGNLYREYSNNNYPSYPFGFIKYVKLNANKQARAAEIFHEITGYTIEEYNDFLVVEYNKQKEEFKEEFEEEFGEMILDGYTVSTPIAETMTYERFKELMGQMSEMVGVGSSYSNFERYGKEELTYENAIKEHENLVKKDKVSGAYARNFSDYMGIVLGLFPAFLVVSFSLKDKRAKMEELIYSRKASSLAIVGSRMLAQTIMVFLPLLILGLISTIEIFLVAKTMSYGIDLLAFVKYSFAWLLPTLMFTVSLSYLITELAENAIAILVQVVVWFYNISGTLLYGDYGLSLMIRHNIFGGYEIYKAGFNEIVRNRIFYGMLSLILFFITTFVYSQKRKGKSYVKRKPIKVFADSSNKSVA